MIRLPQRLRKPCSHVGCPNLTAERFCEQHKEEAKQYDRERGTRQQRGYTNRWLKCRIIYLRAHPLCVVCLKANRVTAATEVDHIIPHKGDPRLFWDESNWQSLCKSCHSTKTANEGGFGHAVKP